MYKIKQILILISYNLTPSTQKKLHFEIEHQLEL